MEKQIESRHASTEVVFDFLSGVPWWIVIIAIVGLFVGFSVLTNARYLDAIYFIFDLPWNKQLIGEVAVQGETWQFTPDPAMPMRPGTYRLYAEFNQIKAQADPEDETLTLYTEPDAESTPTAQLEADETVSFERWEIIPKQGLTPQRNWVYVTTEDGQAGWALDEDFNQRRYNAVAKSELYHIKIPEGAEPSDAAPIQAPTDTLVQVETNTPTITGEILGGVWVRLYDQFDLGETLARILDAKGVMLTLRATIMGFALALMLGLLAGLMLLSSNPITLAISKLYVEVIRGIPMLVIILYAGFVVAPNLRDATGGRVELGRFTGAVLGLGFGYGAYLAEVFRAGIQSIHYGQMEAARSLGMSYFEAMRYVILPQAIRVILPPLGNDFIAMLKDSSLISVVALPEILQQGRLWVSRTFRGFEGYNTVALFYLMMTLLLSLLVRFIERKTALPGRSEE